MSAVLQRVDPVGVLSRAHAVFDELQGLDLTGYGTEQREAYWRELERLRCRIPSLEHPLVQEAEASGTLQERGARTVKQYLRWLLRLDPYEAHGRVEAAHAAARRRALTGEMLAAQYEAVAAAQDGGSISERHARVVVDTIEHLPAGIRDEQGQELAAQLVEHAERFDPAQLGKLARRMAECLDPDGILNDAKHRHGQRDISIKVRPDGSSSGTVQLTAELTEHLLTHFDAFARPKTGPNGQKDTRTPGQRRHDALLEALKANLRAKQLPKVAGVTATIIATMTAEQYASGDGLARTGHGALVPARDVFDWAAGDYRLFLTVLDTVKGVTHYSSTRRLFTENQRLVRHAIDGGCTFPDCDMPALWCEVDHSIDHADGGPTDVRNASLVCDYDNRERKKQGWRPQHINGRVAWIPPRWIDPQQRPRYNLLHNPDRPP